MQLQKAVYYADFVAYPVVVVALALVNFTSLSPGGAHDTWQAAGAWVLTLAAGLAMWSFFEYLLHRFALHWMPVFSPMHAEHHGAPLALIGTPIWVSVTVWTSVILLPAWALFGFNEASGLTIGVMLGYWWYGIVHHVIHHHAKRRTSAYFDGLRAWHMRHHHSPKQGNFGVTSPFWDHLFGTAISARRKAVTSS